MKLFSLLHSIKNQCLKFFVEESECAYTLTCSFLREATCSYHRLSYMIAAILVNGNISIDVCPSGGAIIHFLSVAYLSGQQH